MACRESSIQFLREDGYTPIRVPRERIKPMDLIGRLPGAARPKQIGSLLEIVVPRPGVSPPEIVADEVVSEVSGKKTDKLDIGIGLNLLGTIFRALGAVSASLSAAFSSARHVEFVYEDVLSDSVSILGLRGFLGKHPPLDPDNPAVADYFIGDGQVVVITRTLKSNSFSVLATDDQGRKVDIDVGVLGKDLAKGGVAA